MYDRQVLVDYFNGKRGFDDPDFRREHDLLRSQALSDWRVMYGTKDTQVTVDSIVEDYVHNVKLTAKTQRTFRKIKIIILIAGVVGVTLVFVINLSVLKATAITLLVCLGLWAWWYVRKENYLREIAQRELEFLEGYPVGRRYS